MNRRKTLGIITVSALTTVGLALSAVVFSRSIKPSTPSKAGSYTLTLNSSNGISGTNVTKTESKTTDSGQYQVDFTYTSCSALSGGHATILAGGSIVNKDHIRSIYQIVANFSTEGELKFRSSYDGSNWGGYTSMTSETPYSLGSNPYYVEFVTDGSHPVNVSSIQFSYTCLENPDAQEGQNTSGEDYYQRVTENQSDWSGKYALIYEKTESLGYGFTSSYSNGAYQELSISDGIITDTPSCVVELAPLTGGYSAYMTTGTYGKKYIYGKDNSNYLTSSTTADDCSVVFEDGAAYLYWNNEDGADKPGSYPFAIHGGVAAHGSSSETAATWAFKFFKYDSSILTYPLNGDPRAKLYKLVEAVEPNIPVDEVGFTASDSNANNYSTNSIFDSDNGLAVHANFSDGSSKVLAAGTYSYQIVRDATSEVIDTSAKFPAAGTYTLTVSYGSYIPSVINLNVGEYTYLTGISPRMTTSTFNTANVLSNSISSDLAVDLSYNISSADKTVYYSNLAENDLGISLLDPNGVSKPLTSAFGVAGSWKIRVYSLSDASVYGETTLTVNAIQVINISLNPAEVVLHPTETAQLTVTFNPTNATNQNVSWSSNNTDVATVSNTGLVTAVAIGGPVTITATSQDGGKTATCSVTVKKLVTTSATIVCNASGTENQQVSLSTSDFNTDGITLSGVKTEGSVYYGTSGSLRFGKSSGTGSITFSFDEIVISGVLINAAPWSGDSSTVKISTSANTSGETVSLSETSAADYATTAFKNDSVASTSLTIETTTASKGRAYLYSVTLTVGVVDPVYPNAISLSDQTINVGETVQLTPIFSPSDTNQTAVVWSSTNTSVATVSNTGLVTAVAKGSTTIKATGKDENDNDVVGSCTITVNTVAVTGVTLSKSTATVSVSKSITLSANVTPYNATNKNVTWTSDNTNIATVNSSGLVTGVAAGTATITARTSDGNFTASCTVTVTTVQLDDWTIMIYMCGADLESKYVGQSGYDTWAEDSWCSASSDLYEILNVSGQPSGVNIIIETGGASAWSESNPYSISSSKLSRYYVNNKSLVEDSTSSSLGDDSMGEVSTFQSFLEWGLSEYPADRTGVILWNHGGAMRGVCYDENHSDNTLLDWEVAQATNAAFNTVGRTDKLEFIGYDACLMQLQDVAEMNSNYFNYMIASQESEAGAGWDYNASNGWLKTIYNNPSTVATSTVLTKIVDTFIADNGGVNGTGSTYDGTYYPCDQTLSWLDLSQMSAYKTAWENMAGELKNKINSSNKSSFNSDVIGKTKYFAGSDYDYFCTFDVYHFLSILENNSTFNPGSSYISAVRTAFNNLVKYSSAQQEAAHDAHGLCFYYVAGTGYSQSSYSTSTYSNFTNWTYLSKTYGGSITSTYSY